MPLIDSILLFGFLGAILSIGLARVHLRESDAGGFSLAGRSLPWPRIGLSLVGADAVFAAAFLIPEWSLARPLMFEAALLGVLLLGVLPARLVRGPATTGVPGEASPAGSIWTLVVIGLRMAFTLSVGALLLPSIIGQERAGLLALAILVAGIPAIAGGFIPVVRIQMFCALAICIGAYTVVVAAIPAASVGMTLAQVGAATGITTQGFPFFGAMVAIPVLVLWYWGSDPTIVQHSAAARTAPDATRGMRSAGAVKFLLLGLLLLLWVVVPSEGISRVLSSGPGFRGGAAALVLAVVIASLSGLFTSASTILTPMLFPKPRTSAAGDKTDHLAARLVTTGVIGVALLGIPLVRLGLHGSGALLPGILLLAASPVAALSVFALAGKHLSKTSVRASLAVSGTCAAGLITSLLAGSDAENDALASWGAMHLLDAAAALMVIAAAVAAVAELSRTPGADKRRMVENASRIRSQNARNA